MKWWIKIVYKRLLCWFSGHSYYTFCDYTRTYKTRDTLPLLHRACGKCGKRQTGIPGTPSELFLTTDSGYDMDSITWIPYNRGKRAMQRPV